jgi:hypothetical protein
VQNVITGRQKINDQELVIINGVAVNGWGMDPQFAKWSVGPYFWLHIIVINCVYFGYFY